MKITSQKLNKLIKKIYGEDCFFKTAQISDSDKLVHGKKRFLIVEDYEQSHYIKTEIFANSLTHMYQILINN